MSRNMDKYKPVLAEYASNAEELTELGRKVRAIDKRQKEIKALVIPKMGTSLIGAIDGEDMFEIVPSGRESVSVADVRKFAPEYADILIKKPEGRTIKFLKKVIKK